MKNRPNDQPGAQQHAEGQHGDRARARNLERLQGDTGQPDDRKSNTAPRRAGRHKIHEDRQQHDEADRNSEKNRLVRERDPDDR